jgi:alpha-glucosidase (family GH31 glycosyl hydrolase)
MHVSSAKRSLVLQARCRTDLDTLSEAERGTMGDYIQDLMREAHEKGAPVMQTCLYEFSTDRVCWEVEDQDVFGSQYLVAPILELE